MEIVAETKTGYLIQAKESEIKEILRSVTGEESEEIRIGQKIPAIDYATTITKIKSLKESYNFMQLILKADQFSDEVAQLKYAVEDASKLEV